MFIFIHTHPIQYYAPLYRYLTQQGLPLEVWYMDDSSIRGATDAEFGQQVQWDIPLLEGYQYRFFENKGNLQAGKPRGFNAYSNPALLEALKQHRPATVVVHGWSYRTYVDVLRKAKAWGHQLAFRGETNLAMEMARPTWQRMVRKVLHRWMLKNVSYYCYIGAQSKAFYDYLGVPEGQLYFTPYAVDNQRFQQEALAISKAAAREALGLPEAALVILYSGKYIVKKRPLDLLQAFASMNHKEAMLVMMGDGPLRPQMEAFITQNNLQQNVLLTGFVNQSNVSSYYRSADALVMCSDYGETWGLSVNEAMNFSLPVIVSDRTGCSANLVVQGVNGWVVETGNTQQLSGRLQQFAALSPAEREVMGQKSLHMVDGYSFESILQALRRLQS